MISLREARAIRHRAVTARVAATAARVARIAGDNLAVEEWVKTQAARYPDAGTRALLLGAAAKELSAAGRVPGAVDLVWDAILTARHASKDKMLELLEVAAPVLEAAGMRHELAAIAKVLEELRSW
jgi:hypothetical protein